MQPEAAVETARVPLHARYPKAVLLLVLRAGVPPIPLFIIFLQAHFFLLAISLSFIPRLLPAIFMCKRF